MGVRVIGSKGSNTTTQTTGPAPAAMDAYNSLLNRASGVASTPYTPYTGELVAPVNQQQYTGIGNINQNAGFAAPYIQQAATYANNAAQPLTAAQIQQYQNPYTQSVVNATQGQFNLMNQQALNNIQGNAAMSGALGGDRAGVAKAAYYGAVLPGQEQQIAGLYNQSYNTGLQSAEQQQQNQANAAYSLGNLGVAGQNAALTGANAQIGAGSLEQGTQQALDAALLQQFQTQQAFPYQQTQWLAGIDTGVGSQMGGTSSTTGPAPNPFATIAGLGLTAAGAYFGGSAGAQAGAAAGQALQSSRRGGGIPGLAMGGVPYAGVGWVPSIQITPGRGAPPPPGTPQQQKQSGLGNQASGASAIGSGLWNKFNNQGISTDPVGSGAPLEGSADADSLNYVVPMGGEGFGIGGVIPGFADGGSPTFNDMWAADQGLGSPEQAIAQRYNQGIFDDGRNGDPAWNLPPYMDETGQRFDGPFINARVNEGTVGLGQPVSSPAPGTDVLPGAGVGSRGLPASGLASINPEAVGAYTPPQNPAHAPLAYGPGYDRSGLATNSTPSAAPSSGGISGFLANLPGRGSLSPAASQALMAAGLGMMASRSPFLGVAIGEGGLQGLGAYNQQVQAQFSREMQQEQKNLEERRVNIEANKLAQMVKQYQVPAGYQSAGEGSLEPIPGGPRDPATIQRETIAKGQHIVSFTDPDTGRVGFYNQLTGQVVTPTMPAQPGGQAPAGEPSTGGTQVASADGFVVQNSKMVDAGQPFNYGRNGPTIEKGTPVPDPMPLGGKSSEAIKDAAEYYLETGKLPVGWSVRAGNSPVAVQQSLAAQSAINYASAVAASRGLNASQVADAWRSAPLMGRFILGPAGQQTVSLGTAMRHLDLLREYADAWGGQDFQTLNRVKAAISREFGGTAATNLDTAAHIMGPEIIKAIGVAGGGSAGERESASNQFTTASGHDQIVGAIGVTQGLMRGQLTGKEGQATAAGLTPDKFKNLVGEHEYDRLKQIEGGGTGTPPAQRKFYNGKYYTRGPNGEAVLDSNQNP